MAPRTVSQLKTLTKCWGNHWFDKDTMAFFRTTIETSVLMQCGNGCVLFVSREVDPSGKAGYSIREADTMNKRICTRGGFMKYKCADDAVTTAKRYARFRRYLWESRS